jgi:hypothetical protein
VLSWVTPGDVALAACQVTLDFDINSSNDQVRFGLMLAAPLTGPRRAEERMIAGR